MPIREGKDSYGNYFVNSKSKHPNTHKHKFYFNPKSERSVQLAWNKVRAQQAAMFSNGYKVKK